MAVQIAPFGPHDQQLTKVDRRPSGAEPAPLDARRFVAIPSCAGAKSLLRASPKGYWLRRRDPWRGWTLSSITSVWRLAVDRRQLRKAAMLPVAKHAARGPTRSGPPADPLRVIGIGDWAWRRNHRYASIICNLERRQIVTLLPDREPATAKPGSLLIPIAIFTCHDGGADRSNPAARCTGRRSLASDGEQSSLLDAVRKSMPDPQHNRSTTIDPELLTAAERLQYEGYFAAKRRMRLSWPCRKAACDRQIVRQTGHSRKLVRQAIRGERHDVFRTRQSSLDQHLPWLDDQWASRCQTGPSFGAA